MRMLSEQEANEIEVTWEDQQSINAFSRLNSTYSDLLEDLRLRREERESLDDLSLELELADEDEAVLYKIADTFVSLPHEQAMERLESDKEHANGEIEKLQSEADRYEEEMKGLKVKLYAKFGDNIKTSSDLQLDLPLIPCTCTLTSRHNAKSDFHLPSANTQIQNQ
ncbi:Prefoldin subunit 4 [Pseudozyma hubeiensis]|nr:Prefoldin subunit 4 [Pseudozyma hubeiensis]